MRLLYPKYIRLVQELLDDNYTIITDRITIEKFLTMVNYPNEDIKYIDVLFLKDRNLWGMTGKLSMDHYVEPILLSGELVRNL